MRALATSIHVRTYLPKFNKKLHYYYDTCRGTMCIFYSKYLFWDKILRQLGNNALPTFILSPSPYIKIRKIRGECRLICCSCLGEKFANDVHLDMMPFKIVCSRVAPQTSSNTNARGYHPKISNFRNYRLEMMSILKFSRSADVIQPKAREYLLKMQHFSNFSLVSLSPHPRSRRGAERVR